MATATFREYVIWLQDFRGNWTCWKGSKGDLGVPTTFPSRKKATEGLKRPSVARYKNAIVGSAEVTAKRPPAP